MKRATVVIGANYGDEGKGRTVDFIASGISGDKTVVRFNGGAQSGHTVVLPDGNRFVFAHLGAGSLAGAKTFLAKHYVCNPLLFWREFRSLTDLLRGAPVIAADPRCFITTPYDMIINQLVEDRRGDKRHGSVGVGFGETIERNNYPAFKIWKQDLDKKDDLRQRVLNIRDHWMPMRLAQHKTPGLPKSDNRLGDRLVDGFIDAALQFNNVVPSRGLEFVRGGDVIFEGGQGLMLDQDRGDFPHVTRSNTGIENVLPIARALGLMLDVIYVTRPYLTRHGAGPLNRVFTPDPPIVDQTNEPHPYQGTVRYAILDEAALEKRVKADLDRARYTGVPTTGFLSLTCLDQGNWNGTDAWKTRDKVASFPVRYRAHGPRRDHSEELV